MRRVIVSNVMSLDGFFEGPNKEIDWIMLDEEFFSYAKDMLRSAGTLLFGRTTYLHMAGYWPFAAKDEIADHMNNLAKVVFSGTLEKAEWDNSRLVKTDAAKEVLRLKQQPGKDMVILGSATLASFLFAAGFDRRVPSDSESRSDWRREPALQRNTTNSKAETSTNSGVVVLYYQKA